MQQLADLKKKLYSLGASSTTSEVEIGSTSRKQQIGAKRGAMLEISQELIGSSPNTTKTHFRRLEKERKKEMLTSSKTNIGP